ncbi:hypothetical protein Efla_007415 [Eimeria flavescens]
MLRPRFLPVDKPALEEVSAQTDPAHYDLPLSRLSNRLQARPRRGFLHALAALAAVVAIAGVAFLVLRCYAGSLRIATRARHSERRLASGEEGEGPWPFGGRGELEESCEEPAEREPPGPAQGGLHQPLPPATAGPEDNTSGAARRPGTLPTRGKDMAKIWGLYKKEAPEAAHLRRDHPSSSNESTPPGSPQSARSLLQATAGLEVRRPGTRPTRGKDITKMRRVYKKEALEAAHLRQYYPSSSHKSAPSGSPQPAPISAEGERDVNQSDSDTVSEAAGVSGEREGGRGTESSSSEGEASDGSLNDLDEGLLAFLDELQSAVFEEGRVEAEKKALLELLWTTSDALHASPERQPTTEALTLGMPLVTGVSPSPKTDQQAVTSIPPSSGPSTSSKPQQAPFGKPHEASGVERPSFSKKKAVFSASSSKKRKRLEEYGEHGDLHEEAPAKKPHFPSATGTTSQAVLAAKEEHVSPSDSGRVEEVAGAFAEEEASSGTESSALEDQDSSELLNQLLEEFLRETLHAAESSAAAAYELLLQPEEEISTDFFFELIQEPHASTQREATAEAPIAKPSTDLETTQREGDAQAGPSTDVEPTQDDHPPPESEFQQLAFALSGVIWLEPMLSSFATALQRETRYRQHPFVRLPRDWPRGMAFPGIFAGLRFSTRPKRSLAAILESIRAILAKEILEKDDMEVLGASAFELMGHIGCCFFRPIRSSKPADNVEGLGKRFLAGYYLLAACQVLGPTMRHEEWWTSRMRLPLSPPAWWTEADSHHLQEGRHSELLRKLIKGVQILSERRLPSPEITVYIMRNVLCQEGILQCFTHPEFNAWREIDAAYISETSPDSASASSEEDD